MIIIEDIRDNYTPEMALIIFICRIHFNKATPAEVNDYIERHALDWELFQKIIKAHQIRPFIYNTVSACNINIEISVEEKLKRDCLKIARDNLAKLAELVRLHKVFKKQHITVVNYKGVTLSNLLFDNFISRETSDIDLIIQPQDFSKVYNTLLQEGYITSYYYNPNYEKHFLEIDNELLFHKEGTDIKYKIEVHWAVTHNMMDIPFPNATVFEGIDKMHLLGEFVDVFTLQNHLMILLVHHGVNDIWRTLRHNLDISIFIQRYNAILDWDGVFKSSLKTKINKTTASGLLMSNSLFGTEIPDVFKKEPPGITKLLNNLLRFPSIKRRKLSAENIKQQFMLRDSPKDKLSLLLSYLHAAIVPNMRDIEAFPISPRFYIVYYFIKPFRLLFDR